MAVGETTLSRLVGTMKATFGIGPKATKATLSASGLTAPRTHTLPDATGTLATTADITAAVPPGVMWDYAGFAAPTGFLLCDGAAVSRTTYAALFAAITVLRTGSLTNGSASVTGLSTTDDLRVGMPVTGTGIQAGTTILTIASGTSITLSLTATAGGSQSLRLYHFGVGDGSTTFNVPDSRRRVTVGRGGTGSTTLGSGLGNAGGSETHTLIEAEMPQHSHLPPAPYDAFWVRDAGNGAPGSLSFGAGTLDNAVTATATAGSGAAHNNLQPSLVVTKIIKT